MNFKCYNTDDDRLETNFSISPRGIITSDWGKEKPHWKLLLGSGVMDGDREIFEHDLYLDDEDNLYEVVFDVGGFWLEVDFLVDEEDELPLNVVLENNSKYIGNAYTDPEIYEKYNHDTRKTN